MKKVLSILLAAALLLAVLPTTAFSAGGGGASSAVLDLDGPHTPYVTGDDDCFMPEKSLTRAEAATMIYSLLTAPPTVDPALHFPDVSEKAWYYQYVMGLASVGAVAGLPDGTYQPDREISRAEFVTMLSAFFPLSEGNVTFPDVPGDHWARPYIGNAVARGWVKGYPNGNFGPENNTTRAEAVTILNAVMGREPDRFYIDSAEGGKKILRFVDVPFDHWAYYEITEASVDHAYVRGGNGAETWGGYSVPAAEHKPGYHTISGDLYKVDGAGHFVRDTQDGLLTFGRDGRYTSGDAQLDALLRNIFLSQCRSADSTETNLRKLYSFVCYQNSYLTRTPYPKEGSTGWEVSWAKQMAQTRRGNCYSYAALFAMLARRVGYQARAVSGYVHLNLDGQFVLHGWVEIQVGDKTYVCDPECQGVYCKQINRAWDLFMFQYARNSLPAQPEYRIAGHVMP